MSEEKNRISNKKKRVIRSMVSRLPDNKREAIRLRFWGYQTIDEVAKSLGITWADANRLIDESINDLRRLYFNSEKEVKRDEC